MNDMIECVRCAQRFDASEDGCPACGHLLNDALCAVHPGEPAHGVCVICGDAVCSTCNATEPHYTCPEHRQIPIFQGWAQLYSTNDDVEAQLISENLKSEGVDSEVLSQRDQTFKVELGDFAPVRVLVPAFNYLTAREILEGRMDRTGEVAFACESCGEAYDVGQERCAGCGAALPSAGAPNAPSSA